MLQIWIRRTWILIGLCLAGSCSCRKATRIELTPETLTPHCEGEYTALKAAVFDQHSEPMPDAQVTFTSSNPDVALVDAAGVVTPRKSGTAEITAQSGSARAVVKVSGQLATKLSIGTPELLLHSVLASAGIDAHAVDDSGQQVNGAPVKLVAADPSKLDVQMFGVTSRALGETSVKVSCGSLSASIPIHIVMPEYGGIVVERGPVSLTAGTKRPLAFHELRTDGKTFAFDIPLEITSSDEKILTVDSHGLMTGVTPGTATVRLHGGNYTATIDVKVTPSG